jgi:hypothetical protein
LVGSPEGKRRWDNINMDFREIYVKAVDGINLAEDRDTQRVLVNTVMNFQVS